MRRESINNGTMPNNLQANNFPLLNNVAGELGQPGNTLAAATVIPQAFNMGQQQQQQGIQQNVFSNIKTVINEFLTNKSNQHGSPNTATSTPSVTTINPVNATVTATAATTTATTSIATTTSVPVMSTGASVAPTVPALNAMLANGGVNAFNPHLLNILTNQTSMVANEMTKRRAPGLNANPNDTTINNPSVVAGNSTQTGALPGSLASVNTPNAGLSMMNVGQPGLMSPQLALLQQQQRLMQQQQQARPPNVQTPQLQPQPAAAQTSSVAQVGQAQGAPLTSSQEAMAQFLAQLQNQSNNGQMTAGQQLMLRSLRNFCQQQQQQLQQQNTATPQIPASSSVSAPSIPTGVLNNAVVQQSPQQPMAINNQSQTLWRGTVVWRAQITDNNHEEEYMFNMVANVPRNGTQLTAESW
jgi:hypothetical protein